jgi:hypothetical protein
MSNEYFIDGVQKFTNPNNANYMTLSSDTINATGTIINPKYLSAMVANSVNPTNLNLVNALSVASATTSPAYTINLQSAPAGVGSLWGIDYETTTAEDLQITTSSATSGVNFNTVGGTTSSRIKNGTITSTSSTNTATITPNSFQILQIGSVFNKSTFAINQWILQNGLTTSTQFDPTEINITNGNDTTRVSTTVIGTNNTTTGYSSTMGVGVSLNTLSNVGTRITYDGINLGFNTTTSNSSITMTTTNITNGTLTKTWTDILSTSGATPTLTQVLTAGNTALNLTDIFTATASTLRTSRNNIQIDIADTADAQKFSRFALNTWNLKQSSSIYTQLTPSSFDMATVGDTGRFTSTGASFLNTASTRAGFLGNGGCYVATASVGTHFDKDQINFGYNVGTFSKLLSISATTITRTSPSTTKSWDSLITIGTTLQNNIGSTAITGTRLCYCILNSGSAIPAGTYRVSYMVVFSTSTTSFQCGFATPNAPITEGITASGTLYQYGGSNVNNTGTTGSANVSGSSVIVFDGVKGCAIGIQVVPNQSITSAYLQAVRIA